MFKFVQREKYKMIQVLGQSVPSESVLRTQNREARLIHQKVMLPFRETSTS